MPTYGGTLAAVRALGNAGVELTVAGSEVLAPARWSRHTHRFVRCPPPRDTERFLSWLLAFGEREPGHFLYPTSDDLAWLFSTHAALLRRNFLLFQPPVQTVVQLLDKKRLHALCREVGLPTLPAWFPASLEEVEALENLPRPLLIKPRTQVGLSTGNHGVAVGPGVSLREVYRTRLARDRYAPGPERDFGEPLLPMIQEFVPTDDSGVYSLAGFVGEGSELLGVRASRKLVQRPHRVGVGLCFEEAEVEPALRDAVAHLCRQVGYLGVFEAEFVQRDGRRCLIDFNPRYYGQMHFECARGLPLPKMALLAARGERSELAAVAWEAQRTEGTDARYSFAFGHTLFLALRRIAGTTSAEELERWRAWYRAGHRIDASADKDDLLPGLVHAAAELWGALRHPRGYLVGSILGR